MQHMVIRPKASAGTSGSERERCRMSDPGHMESGRAGSGALSSDRCQLRRGSEALSHDELTPQKRQCLPQSGVDFKHHPYQGLHSQALLLLAALPCRRSGT